MLTDVMQTHKSHAFYIMCECMYLGWLPSVCSLDMSIIGYAESVEEAVSPIYCRKRYRSRDSAGQLR